MYKKSVIKKIGSIVVVAAMIASAFVVLPSSANGGDTHDANISTDYTGAVGGIKITEDGTDVIGADENLTLGETYKIRYKLANDGNYNESADLTVKVENDTDTWIIGTHTYSLNIGESETHYDSWNTTGLLPDTYTIIVNASIPVDNNWTNNERTRDVVLEEAAPTIEVNVVYPLGGEVIGGIIPIEWTATGESELTIKIEYKNETGADWTLIADNEENDGMYNWDATSLSSTDNYMVKVTATDTAVGSGQSGLFNITPLSVTPKTISYNATADAHVDGTSGTVKICYPDGTVYGQQDGSPGDVYFFGTTFDKTGLWYADDSNNGRFYIWVKPIDLNITTSPTAVDFARSGTESYMEPSGTVTNPDGTAADGATVEIWAPGVTPSASATPLKTVTANTTGHYIFTDKVRISLYGAGVYNITARKGAMGNADAFGYVTLTVNTIDANISLYTKEGVSGGFSVGEIVFEVTYPEGDALLTATNYNVSVFKGTELYAWINTSDGTSGGNMTFATYGKYLNITAVDIWELGDYVLKVKADHSGDVTWEYTGEKAFTIPAPDPVNVYVTPSEINILEPALNAQVITIQVLGKTRYTYGGPINLSVGPAPDNENITDRIEISGDVLYASPADAYMYVGEGKWDITVFPAKGGGKIYIDVSWPGNNTVNKNITIGKGGSASAAPTSIIVDKPTDISVVVKDQYDNPTANANVTLVYETGTYGIGSMVVNGTIVGDGSPGKGSQGNYDFTAIASTKANNNIIVIAKFQAGGEMVYGYALIRSEAAHDLNVTVSPVAVLMGEKTKFNINITREEKAYGTNLEVYIMNETELQEFNEDYNELTDMVAAVKVSEGNYTYSGYLDEAGTYYVYIRTPDEKHDNLNKEASFEVTMATVTVNPSMLVKNVDKNMTLVFAVEWNGEPLNGTLLIKGVHEVASFNTYVDDTYTLAIVDGEGNITNVTAIAIGNVTFEFKPAAAGSISTEINGELKVVTPTISVEPETVFLAEENLITLTVSHPLTGQPCPDLEVSGDFPSGYMVLGKTDTNGKVTIGVVPSITGKIKLYVEGDAAGEINIVIGLKIQVPSDIKKDEEITITITTRGGKAVEGATVKFGSDTAGTTNSNGEIKYTPTEKGNFTITAEKSGYYTATKTVTVNDKENPEVPGFEMIGAILGALGAILIIRRRRH